MSDYLDKSMAERSPKPLHYNVCRVLKVFCKLNESRLSVGPNSVSRVLERY
jgi:hypothetical protein